MAPMLDVLFLRSWKLCCQGLLLFLGTLAEIELESGSGDMDFLACWWKWDEIPLFLVLCGGVDSKVILESGEGGEGLHNSVVFASLHSVTDILWWLLPIEEIRCVVCLICKWRVFETQICPHPASSVGWTWWKDFSMARWRISRCSSFCDINLLLKLVETLDDHFKILCRLLFLRLQRIPRRQRIPIVFD